MASYAVERRLALAFDAAASAARSGPKVVVGLPPGSRHALGALAFAVAARRAGMAVTYLGADLPSDDWLAATEGAVAALIGVVASRDRGPALDVARRLRAARPDLVVAFGGRAAQRTIGYLVLPENLADAVSTVARAIEGRPSI
jgi:methylmalonyl-CoA mutase cobalamin-binding subunit